VERLRRQRPDRLRHLGVVAKEELRALCSTAARGGHRREIRQRLWAFYRWCADLEIPELTTLAETIET
jgi:transposase